MNENRLEVQTLLGLLVAEPAGEPDYPGIHLLLIDEDGAGQRRERIFALLEAARDTPRTGETELRLLVYADDECEDYTNKFPFKKHGRPQYNIWVEKRQEDNAYAVRVWDRIGNSEVPELENLMVSELHSAISAMARTARHNPDIQWHYRNFNLEVQHER